MRRLLLAAACCGTFALAGIAQGQNQGGAFQVHYFKQVKALSLDGSRLAILVPAGQDPVGVAARAMAAAGVAVGAIEAWPIQGWAVVPLAPGAVVQNPAQAKALVDRVVATGMVAMATPVFFDDLGGPMWPTPGILAGSAALGGDAPAGLGAVGRVEADPGQVGMYRIATAYRSGIEVLDAANALAQRGDVAFAEPDMIFTGRGGIIPNDPGFPQQWGMHNTGQGGGVVDADIDAPEAWDVETGESSIRVVIIDTGAQQNHPDINQIGGMDFTGQGGGGGPVNQCDNHGTAVAGCVTMRINNSIGGAGVAPNARCASARTFISTIPCTGGWNSQASWTVDTLNWATSISARVTNNSNAYGFTSAAIETAYNNTRTAGMVHFAAAGNNASPNLSYPSSIASVNAVAAMSRNNTRAGFSNWGNGLDFSAPGDDIYTADRTGGDGYGGGDYATVDGTSFASPISAGVAALILSQNPGLTAAQVEARMQQACVDLGAAGYDTNFGWGFVNANNSLDHGSCLNTAAPDNGLSAPGAGIFFDVKALASPLRIREIRSATSSAAGPVSIELRTRTGTYVGNDGSAAGWVLHGTFNGTSDGASFVIDLSSNPVVISSGATVGCYLVSNTTGGVRYTGTGTPPPQTTWTNGELELFSDVARSALFGGTRFQPRCFSGSICYEVAGNCSLLEDFADPLGTWTNQWLYQSSNLENYYTAANSNCDPNYRGNNPCGLWIADTQGCDSGTGGTVSEIIFDAPFASRIRRLAFDVRAFGATTVTVFNPAGGQVVQHVNVDNGVQPPCGGLHVVANSASGIRRIRFERASGNVEGNTAIDNVCVELATPESCDVIDFQHLEQAGTGSRDVGIQVDEDGYRFTKAPGEPFNFNVRQTGNSSYPGSTALYNNTVDGRIILQRIDGAAFNITSIDLANLNSGGPAPVTFTGFYPGGGSVVLATNTGDPNGLPNTLNTITFPNTFCGLERLEWTQTSPFHQFDNLRVATPTRIDFQHLEEAGTGSRDVGTVVNEDGYRITKNPGEPFNFNVRQTGNSSYPGSTALYNNTVDGRIILQRIDGGPFDVCEIKLANLNSGGPAPVNFVGTRVGGGVVNHNTNTGDPNGLPNVLTRNVFPVSFRGLTKLEWTQTTPFHQFDDIIVACSNVSVGCPCACDYDLTTGPNLCDIFDFLAFQNGYDAGDPCSCDKDVSTGPGVCDIFDFLAFQNEYDTGCP